ncbi:MAG: glucokinase [Magnetospirillum sp.]|nr:glucokinase [Magnetospirillum sp.]
MSDKPALIADIGGTHVRFALVRKGEEPANVVILRCSDYVGPAEAAEAYLRAMDGSGRPERAAFAIASPILGDRVAFTNSQWDFSIGDVERALGLERLHVVNDFTAVALSIPHLAARDLVKVGGGEKAAAAPMAALGPGTGLGVSALVPAADGRWVPLASEGGHVTMAAADDKEAAILSWLRRRGGHVSAERVLSGPGLVNVYEAVAAVNGRQAVHKTPETISQRAVDGTCPISGEALGIFFGMLGTVAGNLALTLGARGGVYVAGGILPRMVEAFAASAFRDRFEDKGRFRPYLEAIPTWLIVHPQPAFAGLAGLATE